MSEYIVCSECSNKIYLSTKEKEYIERYGVTELCIKCLLEEEKNFKGPWTQGADGPCAYCGQTFKEAPSPHKGDMVGDEEVLNCPKDRKEPPYVDAATRTGMYGHF